MNADKLRAWQGVLTSRIRKSDTDIADDNIICDDCIAGYYMNNTKTDDLREFFDQQSLKDRYEYILSCFTKSELVEILSETLSREDLEEFANQLDTAFIEWRVR